MSRAVPIGYWLATRTPSSAKPALPLPSPGLPRRGEGRWAVSTARQVIRQVVAGMRLPKVFYFEEVTQRLQFIV